MSACQNRKPVLKVETAPNSNATDWHQNLGRSAIKLSSPRSHDWWTGLQPSSCPGYTADGKLHSLSMPDLATCTRKEVLDYFNNTWTLTELLFSALQSDEAFYRPPYHGLRHPLIFYYVHPAVLYINKFLLAGLLGERINEHFEVLFETGVDEMSWDDMSKNDIQWPTIDDCLEYRRAIYTQVVSLIESHPDLEDGHAPLLHEHPLWSLFMGLEHERIHLETSSVLMRELPIHLVSRPAEWPDDAEHHNDGEKGAQPLPGKDYPHNRLVDVKETSIEFGKPADWPSYGWDNEYGKRSIAVSAFAANEFLISNGEYWNFVVDGGYKRSEFWSEDGWGWRSFRDLQHPTFWVSACSENLHAYKLRTCFEEIPMQWSWPVIVNFHEAQAFCAWKAQTENQKLNLMTEAQHHALRQVCNFENEANTNHLPAQSQPLNLNLKHGTESPVNQYRYNSTAPFYDLFGNVWQWSADHFNQLEGFKTHPYYADFSTPCFDGRHQMILGGSFVSTGDEASAWARFHFRAHFFQHAGIRVVRN